MEMRKKPTDHRQGNLVRFIDAIQILIDMQHEKGKLTESSYTDDGGYQYRTEFIKKMLKILDDIQMFDIVEYGNFYLTSMGRIVLDKGYGEAFDDSDTIICSVDKLSRGYFYEEFMEKLEIAKQRRHDKLCIGRGHCDCSELRRG